MLVMLLGTLLKERCLGVTVMEVTSEMMQS